MVAPKSPGHRVRELFVEGGGTPALFAVHQDATGQARAAHAVVRQGHRRHPRRRHRDDVRGRDGDGSLRRAGGALRRRQRARQGRFQTLVDAGYQPEIAYFECLHELKLIVDLIYQGGLNYMRYSVSDTAEHGDYTGGPARRDRRDGAGDAHRCSGKSRTGPTRAAGLTEHAAGRPSFNETRDRERSSDRTGGCEIADLMPFLEPVKDPLKKTEKEGVGSPS